MRVALAYSTKDRVELTRQTLAPAFDRQPVDLFWIDGSRETEAYELAAASPVGKVFTNIRGGADTAIVFALTRMLADSTYTHVGLLENDVLLPRDWFLRTTMLFARGARDGLSVGAVSARAYDDRVLIQRDGYAVMHNMGAGHVIFTREAAQLVLANYRTGWWPANRSIFAQLSGVDVGSFACFRGNEQHTTADWHFDAILAQHGLSSLALTPSPVEMIGQNPPLTEQGLKLVTEPVEELRNDEAFAVFRDRTRAIRSGELLLDCVGFEHRSYANTRTYFAHQLPCLGACFTGEWRLKWSQGYGPFSYVAKDNAMLTIPVAGACAFVVSGGKHGGKVIVRDKRSGFEVAPDVMPEGDQTAVLGIPVPGTPMYREIELEFSPGTRLFALQTNDPQPILPNVKFDYSALPPVEET